jgi:hypothetical protein
VVQAITRVLRICSSKGLSANGKRNLQHCSPYIPQNGITKLDRRNRAKAAPGSADGRAAGSTRRLVSGAARLPTFRLGHGPVSGNQHQAEAHR